MCERYSLPLSLRICSGTPYMQHHCSKIVVSAFVLLGNGVQRLAETVGDVAAAPCRCLERPGEVGGYQLIDAAGKQVVDFGAVSLLRLDLLANVADVGDDGVFHAWHVEALAHLVERLTLPESVAVLWSLSSAAVVRPPGDRGFHR